MRYVATLLLLRADGKFLLQHRADNATRAPGMWGFFGGGIEEGETPEQALVRECKEELDIDVVDYTLRYQKHCVWTEHEGILHVFTAKFEKQGPITQREGQGMGWFTATDLETLRIIGSDKIAIMEILGNDQTDKK